MFFHVQSKVLRAVTPEYQVCTASLGPQVVTAEMDVTEPKGIGEAKAELDAMDLQVIKESLESRVLLAKRATWRKWDNSGKYYAF